MPRPNASLPAQVSDRLPGPLSEEMATANENARKAAEAASKPASVSTPAATTERPRFNRKPASGAGKAAAAPTVDQPRKPQAGDAIERPELPAVQPPELVRVVDQLREALRVAQRHWETHVRRNKRDGLHPASTELENAVNRIFWVLYRGFSTAVKFQQLWLPLEAGEAFAKAAMSLTGGDPQAWGHELQNGMFGGLADRLTRLLSAVNECLTPLEPWKWRAAFREPVQMLVDQKVSLHQIALIYKLFDRAGQPDMALARQLVQGKLEVEEYDLIEEPDPRQRHFPRQAPNCGNLVSFAGGLRSPHDFGDDSAGDVDDDDDDTAANGLAALAALADDNEEFDDEEME